MKISLFALILIAMLSASAAADPWNLSADLNLTLTQNAYSNNWVGGESGSLTWQFNSNSLAEKQMKAWLNNKNTLKLFFGQTHSQDKDSKIWQAPVKATDLIDLESTFRFTLGSFVDPIFAVRAISQFFDQSDPAKERWLNPLDITETIGVARVFIKEENREWIARIGGGLKQNINRDRLVSETGARETKIVTTAGFEFVNDYKTPVGGDKATYTSKLSVFQGVYSTESDKLVGLPNENDWKYPDINFENIFTVNLTKYLIMNLYMQILYDREISRSGRLKETMSLGITYKLL
ncbi:MAG: DUF3078 domain-containing protein [Candidatus Latescibacterota bacterium]